MQKLKLPVTEPNPLLKSLIMHYIHLILILLLSLMPNFGYAQSQPPVPIKTPLEPSAIYLYGPPKPGLPPEQWEQATFGRIIRNVVTPTLIPVLPDSAKATGTAVIIAPGGAFRLLAMDHEGYDAAQWFADRGIAAFILKYRLEETPRPPAEYAVFMQKLMQGFLAEVNSGYFQPQTPVVAQEDAAAAIKLIRSRASEWGVNPERVGIVGFSAGALIAVCNAVSSDSTSRANFIASLYGQLVLKPVPADAAPMFVAMASDDPLSGQGGFEVITAWQKAKRPVELHLYAQGGHGFGLRQQGKTSDSWGEQFVKWLKCLHFLD